MAEANPYEELRRRNMEENERRMEQLRLRHLSAAASEAGTKPPPTKTKWLKHKAPVPRDAPLRRSSRVADLREQPDYREERAYAITNEERAYAVTKAEELEEELGSDRPTFVKPMTKSYIIASCLPISALFGKKMDLREGETIVLVDQVGDEFDMMYNTIKNTQQYQLRAGWRRFAVNHKLVDGDCVVFHQIERAKFKVYIIKSRGVTATVAAHDGPVGRVLPRGGAQATSPSSSPVLWLASGRLITESTRSGR